MFLICLNIKFIATVEKCTEISRLFITWKVSKSLNSIRMKSDCRFSFACWLLKSHLFQFPQTEISLIFFVEIQSNWNYCWRCGWSDSKCNWMYGKHLGLLNDSWNCWKLFKSFFYSLRSVEFPKTTFLHSRQSNCNYN